MIKVFCPRLPRKEREYGCLQDFCFAKLRRAKCEQPSLSLRKDGGVRAACPYVADLPCAAVMTVLALAGVTVEQYVFAFQIFMKHAHIVKLLKPLADMLQDGVFA